MGKEPIYIYNTSSDQDFLKQLLDTAFSWDDGRYYATFVRSGNYICNVLLFVMKSSYVTASVFPQAEAGLLFFAKREGTSYDYRKLATTSM